MNTAITTNQFPVVDKLLAVLNHLKSVLGFSGSQTGCFSDRFFYRK
jgi:hypothetical protein